MHVHVYVKCYTYVLMVIHMHLLGCHVHLATHICNQRLQSLNLCVRFHLWRDVFNIMWFGCSTSNKRNSHDGTKLYWKWRKVSM